MIARKWRAALGAAVLTLATQPVLAQSGPMGAFADTAVRDLIGADVMGADGIALGEVERVVQQNGSVLAVVGVGGFLGFGEHDVALPLTEFAQDETGLSLAAYTEDDLKALIAWNGEGEVMPLNMTVAGAPLEEPAIEQPIAPEAPATE